MINFEFGGDAEAENTTFAPAKKRLVAGPIVHFALPPAGFLDIGTMRFNKPHKPEVYFAVEFWKHKFGASSKRPVPKRSLRSLVKNTTSDRIFASVLGSPRSALLPA